MSIFSKGKVVVWPKSQSLEIYHDKKENNTLSFDINLWTPQNDTDLQPFSLYVQQNGIESCVVLVPDDVVYTRSFIYDTQISQIDKKEVIGLAEGFIKFKIDPSSLEYKLVPDTNKTVIQTTIYDKSKVDILISNLEKTGIKSCSVKTISSSISNAISTFFDKEYFILYPLNNSEYTLILSKAGSVYLTSNLKGSSLDIQKIINYSNLYFSGPTTKIYLPQNKEIEISSTTELEKTQYNESQISQNLGKPSNFPLPVLGVMISQSETKPAIITQVKDISSGKNKMENKKNVLPIIAVFVVTAAAAAIIIYFILNRNISPQETVVAEVTPTLTQSEMIPTETPIPTVAEISKKLKLQVLNATSISGQAATVKEMLTKLGFTDVTVGNSKETLSGNEVRIKTSLEGVKEYFGQNLSGKFDAEYSSELKDSSNYDVIFVIGVDLSTSTASGETSPTPTEKVSVTPTTKASVTITPTP
ncbi:MAG: LytR C-terminal domain-containing protein [Candidatus Shapirobacteria bacterium]|jgi:hypothetical protein